MPPAPLTQIVLSTSRTHGLVAIAHGEEHHRAAQDLAEAGFQRLPSGAFAAPLADRPSALRMARALVHRAREHDITITASTRPFLADFGHDLADRLPGTWSAELQIYGHPLIQEDLWYGLWEAGEIHRALQDHQIPYSAVLRNGTGTELLLVERPGHRTGYLLGALTEHEKEDVRADPSTPRTLVLPAEADLAAHAAARTFLPAYRRALHHRDLNTVLSALERIRAEHETLQAIRESGRYSDGVPLAGTRMIPEVEATFADYAWLSFRHVLEHAPALLSRCRPALTAWPQDAAVLDRLRTAVADSQEAWAEDRGLSGVLFCADGWRRARSRFGLAVLPAIETWLAHSAVFERQARAAVPGGPVALSAPSPRLLTARPATPAVSRAPAAHR
ncbi:hypothetical protein GPA10_37480 [Streptomyces sp. p1417]|uniref:Uncharacterized protein n=1 Tax=Streptomyces typhae TaxID=2681492 RepID=A0A6L6X8P3_9ACTN|nr:hypothetical protein [Streptomyces typhae]MVO90293.1 hypothetical protein [Streptomyces typhae]